MENIRDFEIKHINEKVLQITYTGKNSKIDKCINELSNKFATFHLVTLLLRALAENTPTSSEQCAAPAVSVCTCALESTDVYDDGGNYLGYVCLGCGYFSKY